jgi:transposase
VNQQNIFDPVPQSKLQTLTQEELIEFILLQQKVNETIIKDNERLRGLNNELKQKTLYVEEQYIVLKNKMFGKSSEKAPSKEDQKKANSKKGKKKKKRKVQLPSLRYPNAPLIEREVELKELPQCSCCGDKMQDSGMTENSEFLTVIPAQYMVVRQKRHIYRCSHCHGDMKTAPCPARITPGSSYSDEMTIDVAMSKYCDLIPIERYAAIAGRLGLMDLPPQSLIEQSHSLADFTNVAYEMLKGEIIRDLVLNADETPQRMLEGGGEKNSWYLWGFSTPKTSYFEIHNTRSGDVCSEILRNSKCEFLVSDVFSGYGKSVKDTNQYRSEHNLPLIKNVYCNAHARRKFKEALEPYPDEAQYFIDLYAKIYRLEKIAKARPLDRILRVRKIMTQFFEAMKLRAMENIKGYSSKSKIAQAMGYFLKNYSELTLFVQNQLLPIDNNSQESLLRNPVVGRKTWYGTHSQRGAKTAAILFSLVESCKLNKVNPREYFKKLVQDLHQGKPPFTPSTYANLQK